MSTEVRHHEAPAVAAARRAGFAQVALSEWVKLRSVRSAYYSLAATALSAVTVAVLTCATTVSRWPVLTPAQKASVDPVRLSFAGWPVAQLIVGVLGALAMTSEYGTGLIRVTLAAVPQRSMLLAAKCAVFGAVVLALSEVLAFTTFYTGQSILSARHIQVTLTHPGALRAVLAAGLYLTVVALVGIGLGTVIRHTAGAVTALVGWQFVAPVVISLLPSDWARHRPLPARQRRRPADGHQPRPAAHVRALRLRTVRRVRPGRPGGRVHPDPPPGRLTLPLPSPLISQGDPP